MTRPIIKGLYAITPDWEDTTLLTDKVVEVLEAGASVLQYRNKTANKQLRLDQALAIKKICQRYAVPFIINDDLLHLTSDPGISNSNNKREEDLRAVIRAEIIGHARRILASNTSPSPVSLSERYAKNEPFTKVTEKIGMVREPDIVLVGRKTQHS